MIDLKPLDNLSSESILKKRVSSKRNCMNELRKCSKLTKFIKASSLFSINFILRFLKMLNYINHTQTHIKPISN